MVEWLGQKPGQSDKQMSVVNKVDVGNPCQQFTHEEAEKQGEGPDHHCCVHLGIPRAP